MRFLIDVMQKALKKEEQLINKKPNQSWALIKSIFYFHFTQLTNPIPAK